MNYFNSGFLVVVFACIALVSSAYSSFGVSTRRSTMTMKRRAGGFSKKQSRSVGGESSDQVAPSGRWVSVAGLKSTSDLPTEQGKVQLVDTMADVLVNAGTNPTGAVSVVRYGDNTYCFSSSCPSCKIPLSKAKMMDPNDETKADPRIVCDFCSATYNVRTGEKVTTVEGGGLFGGITKAVFSSKSTGNLPTYGLGEKDGTVLINLG